MTLLHSPPQVGCAILDLTFSYNHAVILFGKSGNFVAAKNIVASQFPQMGFDFLFNFFDRLAVEDACVLLSEMLQLNPGHRHLLATIVSRYTEQLFPAVYHRALELLVPIFEGNLNLLPTIKTFLKDSSLKLPPSTKK